MPKETYTVQSGESLSSIARDILGDIDRWPEIAYINYLDAPYRIMPGQTLLLPLSQPIEVTVTRGTGQAAPAREASFKSNPATVALIVIGTALYFWDEF